MRAVWIILGLALVVSVAATWRIIRDMRGQVGDGRHAETYGFDLSNLTIPREQLLGAGFPKDGVKALSHPAMLDRAGLAKANSGAHGKYLLPGDLVIGVHFGGVAKAYPRAFMMQHEIVNDTIVNDTVGEHFFAVTYNPLCDSVVVFNRTIAQGERPKEFGVSGLVYNSNLVMYDHKLAADVADRGKESLWSQLQFRAIAGPAAGKHSVLGVLPCQVVTWGRWLEQFPDSLVMAKAPGDAESGISYGNYFSNDEIKFPLSPAWVDRGWPCKTRMAAVFEGGQWRLFNLPELKGMAAEKRAAALTAGRVAFDPATETLWEAVPEDRPVVYAFLFAWEAMH